MRIATSQIYASATRQMGARQTELAHLQNQIASGKRILKPSDDPVGAAQVLDITQGVERMAQFSKNGVLLNQELALQEATLESVTNVLHRVRELAVAANTGVQTRESRGAYVAEVSERLDELVNLANTRKANGDYLFSGFKGQTKPFIGTAGAVSYVGDQGQRSLQVAEARNIAGPDTGHAVFERIRNGNGAFAVSANAANAGTGIIGPGSVVDSSIYQGESYAVRFSGPGAFDVVDVGSGATVLAAQPYVAGGAITFGGVETNVIGAPEAGDEFTITPSNHQDIFVTLQQFVDAAANTESGGAADARFAQSMSAVIADIDLALGHVLDVRAAAGARINAIDATMDENDAVKSELEVTLSRTRDVDMVEAISNLEQELTALQAVQQSFVRIEELSLFNLLR